ncbi:hypothetical protein JNUCC1_02624 [Lentibacillus sp. JNUCC-1]|uniref:hypothetical protein n=1 Tax=Lentibacillus sp. JNUCC-1 TaxID=2654513 RepID=UPI0012E74BFA|nr:hypothetical protein [Lentibacillus sp. JNUCC-1]MUV38753.1 hypothetical protein [Lentibacillus sp. JNUCC-1]
MNTTGFIRGYMSKGYDGERFLHHVAGTVQRQLQEWDEAYAVEVIKMHSYVVSVRNRDETINLIISEGLLSSLQDRSPYALDRYIWSALEEGGLEIRDFEGNYLEYVLM